MTAPRAEPHVRPMEMFLRYPPGHEKEGSRVARGPVRCACGETFYQGQIDPAWLDRMPPHQSKLFVEQAAQIERTDGTVWIPKACPHCERQELNSPPQKELTSGRNPAGKD